MNAAPDAPQASAAGQPPTTDHHGTVSRALQALGIRQILARSPEARGRRERAFGTIQGRLPQELRAAGITTYAAANRYLEEHFVPDFNRRFTVRPLDPASAFVPHPVGVVRSRITARKDVPKQGSEGAPEAWVEIDPTFVDALDGITAGQEVILLTWLHQGRRDVLQVHPRDDPDNPLKGVFATRSPDRPNPIGLHRVRVLEIAGSVRLRVEPLEALDGTPVVDLKPVLPGSIDA